MHKKKEEGTDKKIITFFFLLVFANLLTFFYTIIHEDYIEQREVTVNQTVKEHSVNSPGLFPGLEREIGWW